MESRFPRNDTTSASSSRSRKFITDELEDQRAIRRRTQPTSGASVEGFSPTQSKFLSETNNETTLVAPSAEGFRPTHELELPETSNGTSTTSSVICRNKNAINEVKETGGSTPYACKYCSKSFVASQGLGGHMNCHRREREEDEVNDAIKLLSTHHVITTQPLTAGPISSFPSTSTQSPPRCPFPLINTNPANQYPPAGPNYASAEAVHGPHDIAGSQSHFRSGISDQNSRLPLADQPSTVVTADTHVDTSSSSPLQRGRLASGHMELPSRRCSSSRLMQQHLCSQWKRRIFDSTNNMQQLQNITPDQRTPNIVVHESNNNLANSSYTNLLEGLSETSNTPNIEAVQRRPQIEAEALRCTEAGIFTSSSMLTPSSFIQTNVIDSVDHLPLSSTQQSERTPFLSQTAAGYADFENYYSRPGIMNIPSVVSSEAPFHRIMEATTTETSDPILQYLRDSPLNE